MTKCNYKYLQVCTSNLEQAVPILKSQAMAYTTSAEYATSCSLANNIMNTSTNLNSYFTIAINYCYVGYNQAYTSDYTVRCLQSLLNHYGYSLTVDGQFGPNTHSASLAFQSRFGLSCDGICGPNTWWTLWHAF